MQSRPSRATSSPGSGTGRATRTAGISTEEGTRAEVPEPEAGHQGAGAADRDNEGKRSAVRRCVTYAVTYVYLGLAAVVVLWLMWAGRYEIAIGVLGGVAGLAGSISGFWFGSRRPSQSGQ